MPIPFILFTVDIITGDMMLIDKDEVGTKLHIMELNVLLFISKRSDGQWLYKEGI